MALCAGPTLQTAIAHITIYNTYPEHFLLPLGHFTDCPSSMGTPSQPTGTLLSWLVAMAALLAVSGHVSSQAPTAQRLTGDNARPPPVCAPMVHTDLICHNITRGGKGPPGHYAVWCDDLGQVPCSGPLACCSLCEKNAVNLRFARLPVMEPCLSGYAQFRGAKGV